ncbi:MAG: helix-turn-helix domain-containing protein [Candidatus Binatia bacterium]
MRSGSRSRGAEREGEPVRLGRRRRTQQRRSAETQAKLLEATVACLVERGYARLTTAALSERAGMSQGALFLHYPTKADVVVAAVEYVFARLASRYRQLLGAADRHRDRVGRAVRALWRVLTLPEYLATNEVYLAARSNPDLRDAIRPMALRHQENLLRSARELHGNDVGPIAHFDEAFDTLILAMQAAAIDSVALQDRRIDARRLAYFEALLRRELRRGGNKHETKRRRRA